MSQRYYSDEEVDYYHDRLSFYADQVANREITLNQVPRQLLLDSAFFDRVFFLVTGNKEGIELYQKKLILQTYIAERQAQIDASHCSDKVSATSMDIVQ